jgi:hypothetical protein
MENHVLLVSLVLIAATAFAVLVWQIAGFNRKLGGPAKPSKKDKKQSDGGFIL